MRVARRIGTVCSLIVSGRFSTGLSSDSAITISGSRGDS